MKGAYFEDPRILMNVTKVNKTSNETYNMVGPEPLSHCLSMVVLNFISENGSVQTSAIYRYGW